jgi:hypothetical protein
VLATLLAAAAFLLTGRADEPRHGPPSSALTRVGDEDGEFPTYLVPQSGLTEN